MHPTIESFARTEIKKGLAHCTPEEWMLFKRMYSPRDLKADMDDVVNEIPTDKLDSALGLVNRTISKRLGIDTGVIKKLNGETE